jgi:type I restriction enzyme M protein
LDSGQLKWIANFIWNIADDVLRGVYVRGKYRDVILPMVVIRRLDAVLEDTKNAVLKQKEKLEKAGIVNQEAALKRAAGQAFYNKSEFRLMDLKSRAKQQQLKLDFEAYLDGFSDNVQEILSKFKFRNQIATLVEADILGGLIEKFLDKSINLSPKPVMDENGNEKLPALDNHAMGTIFEELIRRFNEENNEEAGEHFTPRDVVKLMANLILLPIADQIKPGTYTVYDGACGTGGMLTVAEESLHKLAGDKEVSIHLFGQESQPETYAISKADLLLKGEGEEAENFANGSTLSQDAFPSREFDFMLSNPPYGKSWKTDLERMGGKTDIQDQRFVVEHAGDPEFSLITRSNDGQLMFLVNKLSKMKRDTPLGSRIAEVHNGSSLFTGDAGQGESNIRRWIIENDWLEAIIALPLNMFYNTGIATYIWVLSNRKTKKRKGKVQLIDATSISTPLRKNLGKKNCEFSEDQIGFITKLFLDFKSTDVSKIFPNEEFGYWKIVVERPLRLAFHITKERLKAFKESAAKAWMEPLEILVKIAGMDTQHRDFNIIREQFEAELTTAGINLRAAALKNIYDAFTEKDPNAEPVIKKKTKKSVVYEPDPELRDTEQVPLLEPGGIEAFFSREVLPHMPDAWIDDSKTLIGYEISFTRHFYKPQPLRSLDEIRIDLQNLQAEAEGLLDRIVAMGASQ